MNIFIFNLCVTRISIRPLWKCLSKTCECSLAKLSIEAPTILIYFHTKQRSSGHQFYWKWHWFFFPQVLSNSKVQWQQLNPIQRKRIKMYEITSQRYSNDNIILSKTVFSFIPIFFSSFFMLSIITRWQGQ